MQRSLSINDSRSPSLLPLLKNNSALFFLQVRDAPEPCPDAGWHRLPRTLGAGDVSRPGTSVTHRPYMSGIVKGRSQVLSTAGTTPSVGVSSLPYQLERPLRPTVIAGSW